MSTLCYLNTAPRIIAAQNISTNADRSMSICCQKNNGDIFGFLPSGRTLFMNLVFPEGRERFILRDWRIDLSKGILRPYSSLYQDEHDLTGAYAFPEIQERQNLLMRIAGQETQVGYLWRAENTGVLADIVPPELHDIVYKFRDASLS